MFQVVSSKQWTAWVYLLSHSKRSVLNNRQLEFTFLSSKSVIPCFIRKQGVAQFFAFNIKVIIPRFGGGRSVDNLISRYVGWRDVAQFPFQVSFPVCRMTKCQRCHPQCVWSRDVINQNVCFLQTISSNTFQNFSMSIQDFVFLSFIFILLSTR